MKQRRGKRGKVERMIAAGTTASVRSLIQRSQGHGSINTAYIERLNATFRLRLHCLVRSSRSLIRHPQTLEAWMWLVGSCYNFCTEHEALRLKVLISTRQHVCATRTPAMAAGLTDHRWTVAELLAFKHPPDGWLFSRTFEGTRR
jgi:hypothetical protein